MIEQIYEFLKVHPIIGSIAIPIILGIITSFVSETIKQKWFEDDPVNPRSKNIFRWITLVLALLFCLLSLGALWDWVNDWFLRVLYVFLNTSVPFLFYHLKGKDIVDVIVKKMLTKTESV